VRIIGRSPLCAVCWLCQALRCTVCGHLFTAPAPEKASGPKHDETAVSMIIILRYGTGLPHHRLAKLQANLRTPIPPSTLWDVVDGAAGVFRPVYDELRRQAAQSKLLYFDDSYVRILELMGKSRTRLEAAGKLSNPDRTGLFTTGIVAVTDRGRQIALFCSGRNHAGENMAELLSQREQGLSPPALMCDGLDRNVPKGHTVIEGNCMSHGRRQVCDEAQNFPAECARILERIARVYRVEKLCRGYKLSDDDRLGVHQRWSGPVLDEIHKWMTAQLDDKRVEPNSGMGKAISYLLKRWDKLTLFLRRPGAPLDNNICERLLKVAIQHRKNSLFFKTADGAKVGDLFMSLIATAVLNDVNALDYLTEVQRHTKAAAEKPADWLPWNYRETLTSMAATQTPAPLMNVPLATTPHQRPPPN
jgi:transposase